jgi:hypothetical protein
LATAIPKKDVFSLSDVVFMSAEYRFLRFEIVGIATIVFLVIGILPLLNSASLTSWISDADTAIAVVASLFILSLPLGYAEHQIVVNVNRSHKAARAVFKILEATVLKAQEDFVRAHSSTQRQFFMSFDDKQKNAFLTSLLDLYVYSKESIADPNIFNRLSERWSHFYARRAVGKYAPIFSIILWILIVILGYAFSWPIIFQLPNFVMSLIWWGVIFVLCIRLIDTYAQKIWFEISFLETSIVLANREKIEPIIVKIVSSMIEHPEYIERGTSYGAAFYRL